ncbi:hypothetical protein PINS_up001874 [Pythium insidiosum]|nr:hypothetical protein PINS_up001874 [Pythium insidiosum]
MCFSLALQKDAIDGQDAERAESYRQHRRRRLLKVKRGAGLVSVDSLFDRKLRVQTTTAGNNKQRRGGDGDGDDGNEDAHEDDGDDDDLQLHPEADEVLSVVHRSLKPEFHNWGLEYGYSTSTRWQTATTYVESTEPNPTDPFANLSGVRVSLLQSVCVGCHGLTERTIAVGARKISHGGRRAHAHAR